MENGSCRTQLVWRIVGFNAAGKEIILREALSRNGLESALPGIQKSKWLQGLYSNIHLVELRLPVEEIAKRKKGR